MEYRRIVNALSTDYLLAKQLYNRFIPLEEDGIVLATLREYEAQRSLVENEVAAVRAGFPFNAVDTMNDPEKTRQYLAELEVRAKRCEIEKSDLEKKIAHMMLLHGSVHFRDLFAIDLCEGREAFQVVFTENCALGFIADVSISAVASPPGWRRFSRPTLPCPPAWLRGFRSPR